MDEGQRMEERRERERERESWKWSGMADDRETARPPPPVAMHPLRAQQQSTVINWNGEAEIGS
jgi:hypothetical protein